METDRWNGPPQGVSLTPRRPSHKQAAGENDVTVLKLVLGIIYLSNG